MKQSDWLLLGGGAILLFMFMGSRRGGANFNPNMQLQTAFGPQGVNYRNTGNYQGGGYLQTATGSGTVTPSAAQYLQTYGKPGG